MVDSLSAQEYFGTFLRAMLTMFQLTLGTWVPVARILQETVSPYFNIFTILHKVPKLKKILSFPQDYCAFFQEILRLLIITC